MHVCWDLTCQHWMTTLPRLIRLPNCTTGFCRKYSQTTCQTYIVPLPQKCPLFQPSCHTLLMFSYGFWTTTAEKSLLPVSVSDPFKILVNLKHDNHQNVQFSETAQFNLYISNNIIPESSVQLHLSTYSNPHNVDIIIITSGVFVHAAEESTANANWQ